jgi:acyl-CoA hydrolase
MNVNPYISAAEAVQAVRSGHRVFIHGSAATPVHLIEALQARHAELEDVELISITTLGNVKFQQARIPQCLFL